MSTCAGQPIIARCSSRPGLRRLYSACARRMLIGPDKKLHHQQKWTWNFPTVRKMINTRAHKSVHFGQNTLTEKTNVLPKNFTVRPRKMGFENPPDFVVPSDEKRKVTPIFLSLSFQFMRERSERSGVIKPLMSRQFCFSRPNPSWRKDAERG